MKRYWPLVFFLPCLILAQGQQTPRPTPPFRLSLPLNVKPETVQIQTGIYGQGLVMRALRTIPGVFDYFIDVGNSEVGPARSLKLLIYIPGYQMVAEEFKDADVQTGKTFIPPLVPLPSTAVKGRLVDSAEKPLGDQTLNVGYRLSEAMPYFGYLDGSVPSIPIGSTKTDSKGEFIINVPSLLDDPFFQGNGRLAGQFQLGSDNEKVFWDQTLYPNSFPIQKTYEPLTVRKIQKGTLSGKLGKEFFQQNNLSTDLKVYVRPGDTLVTGIDLRAAARNGGTTYIAYLKLDGSFEQQMPPGEYDLTLWVSGIAKRIPVQNGVAIAENGRRVVERP